MVKEYWPLSEWPVSENRQLKEVYIRNLTFPIDRNRALNPVCNNLRLFPRMRLKVSVLKANLLRQNAPKRFPALALPTRRYLDTFRGASLVGMNCRPNYIMKERSTVLLLLIFWKGNHRTSSSSKRPRENAPGGPYYWSPGWRLLKKWFIHILHSHIGFQSALQPYPGCRIYYFIFPNSECQYWLIFFTEPCLLR